jgi:hypothetical protein
MAIAAELHFDRVLARHTLRPVVCESPLPSCSAPVQHVHHNLHCCAAASILYYKGLVVRGQGRWPAIDAWFNAMETRDTYLGIKSDVYTHVFDLPPQIGGEHLCLCSEKMATEYTGHAESAQPVQAMPVVSQGTADRRSNCSQLVPWLICAGCVSVPEAEDVAAALDGSDDTSWHLPLSPLSSTSLECHAPGEHVYCFCPRTLEWMVHTTKWSNRCISAGSFQTRLSLASRQVMCQSGMSCTRPTGW